MTWWNVEYQLWLNLNMEQQSPHGIQFIRDFQVKGLICLIPTPRRDRVWAMSGEAQAESGHEGVYDAIGAHTCSRCRLASFISID